MALDGAFLHCLIDELNPLLRDARVDKVHQPSREELVFVLRTRTGHHRLYLSAAGGAPRLHLTQVALDNPPVPPMFCMLLRKRLTGARVIGLRQCGLERVVYIDLRGQTELGDPVSLTLAAELTGRHANLLLLEEDVIVDALKRVDPASSPDRPLLPGLRYAPPPALAGCADVSLCPAEDIAAQAAAQGNLPLSRALRQVTQGLSPLICREIALLATRGQDTPADALAGDQADRLVFYLRRVQNAIRTGEHRAPTLLYTTGDEPLDFSFMPITQYGLSAVSRPADSFSSVLDRFYAERDAAARRRQRSHDILRTLKAAADRVARKLDHQREELRRSAGRDTLRLYGDLLTAQAHALPRGAASADVPNYYEPDAPLVRIPLDPALSAAQNAQKYYKDYRKAQTAEKKLAEQIALGEQEAAYIDTVFDALSRAATLRELDDIRAELTAGGYLKARGGRRKPPAPLGPERYTSDDGFAILVGRNNLQNDQLTLKTARGGDVWLHVKDQPGSHTIIVTQGKQPPARTLEQAAMLAALHSKAAGSSQVPVDVTAARHVRKPAGARPGMVIYDHQRTLYVTPDPLLATRLRTGDG